MYCCIADTIDTKDTRKHFIMNILELYAGQPVIINHSIYIGVGENWCINI